MLLVLGDFHAKTGSGHRIYPGNIGKFGKGHVNSNGECLLEYAKENDLILTNTLIQHQLAHRTTWTCAERINPYHSADGTIRRNPCRNQIDYSQISAKQKKLRGDIESTKDKAKRRALRKERNETLKELKRLFKEQENKLLDEELKEIERYKIDSSKCYQAIRKVNSRKPQKPLTIYDEQFRLVTAEEEQVQIITEYFQNLFSSEDTPTAVEPAIMTPPIFDPQIWAIFYPFLMFNRMFLI